MKIAHFIAIAVAFCLNNNLLIASKNSVQKVILTSRNDAGMFAALDDALNLVRHYEKGLYESVAIDFGLEGLYYEESRGANWWNYYFEPITYGKNPHASHTQKMTYISSHGLKMTQANRHDAQRFIKKHLRIKPEIIQSIESFYEKNFKNHFIISVHYRGTDKITEAPRVSYEQVANTIHEIMKNYGNLQYRIFVASDEQQCIDYLVAVFGSIVFYQDDFNRSNNGQPMHITKTDGGYLCGRSALTDCLLLSRGNFLIKSCSNLSRWATFFNPKLPFIQLNKHFKQPGL